MNALPLESIFKKIQSAKDKERNTDMCEVTIKGSESLILALLGGKYEEEI